MSIVPNWILFHECVDSRNACNHSSGSRLACYHSIDDRTHTYGIIVVTLRIHVLARCSEERESTSKFLLTIGYD